MNFESQSQLNFQFEFRIEFRILQGATAKQIRSVIALPNKGLNSAIASVLVSTRYTVTRNRFSYVVRNCSGGGMKQERKQNVHLRSVATNKQRPPVCLSFFLSFTIQEQTAGAGVTQVP